MGKISSKMLSALTNSFLVAILLAIGTVCFYPMATSVADVGEKPVYRGVSTDGVSLMFNVYWGTEEVYAILDVLDEYSATATFFLGGCWADDNVDCVREIVNRGHEIGSHGYFHRDHDKLGHEENVQEIKTSLDFLEKSTGIRPKLFAPPSGAWNKETVLVASALGCKTVLWSKDTIDWRDKDEEICFKRATDGVKGGELILMHPQKHTLKALPRILEYYKQNALRTIPVGGNIIEQGEKT